MERSNAVLFHQLMCVSCATTLHVRFHIQKRPRCITCHINSILAKLRVLSKIRFVADGSSFEPFSAEADMPLVLGRSKLCCCCRYTPLWSISTRQPSSCLLQYC